MQSVIFTVLGFLIGLALAGTGLYYWNKEKHDLESVSIYRTVTMIGCVIIVGLAVKTFML